MIVVLLNEVLSAIAIFSQDFFLCYCESVHLCIGAEFLLVVIVHLQITAILVHVR